MTISIEYTSYPDIIATITLDTGATQQFVLTLTDASTISIVANDSGSGESVTNSLTKEELLDMIKMLQEMIDQMT